MYPKKEHVVVYMEVPTLLFYIIARCLLLPAHSHTILCVYDLMKNAIRMNEAIIPIGSLSGAYKGLDGTCTRPRPVCSVLLPNM